jgi:hypothetical protein
VDFQVIVTVRNFDIDQFIVDDEDSSCVMSLAIWKQMGSLDLTPSHITSRASHGNSSQSLGVLNNLTITLDGKIISIIVEVMDAPLDCKMLLGRNYIYFMKVVASFVFHTM